MDRITIDNLELVSTNTYHNKIDSNLIESFLYAIKANPNKDLVFEVLRSEKDTIISVYQDAGTDYVLIIGSSILGLMFLLLLLFTVWAARK